MADDILRLEHLSKSFPGVKALDDITFAVQRGTVHALVGENGAGKSTLIKILAGIYQADAGAFIFDNQEQRYKTPSESQAAGISVVHQEIKLVDTLSVTENIFLGNYLYKNRMINWKVMRGKAKAMIDALGVSIDAGEIVSALTMAKKQIVEICKAINHNCKLMIMDEPSATLTDKEIEILFDIIAKLKEQGITVIYISHRLDEIFRIADLVTVLRDGKHIGTQDVSSVDRKMLISMMVGRALENEYPKETVQRGETVLKVEHLTREGILHDISFEAHRGEILGIAGLVGSGRTELARAVLGIDQPDSGTVTVNGKSVSIKNFGHAIRNSLGLVPEDRKKQGLILPFPLKVNISLVNIIGIIVKGFLSKRLEDESAEKYVKMLRIHTPSIEETVENLSGGNQQKVVIAKWLMQDSQIIFLDEPTRGVDVGAKSEIFKLIGEMVKNGKTVIMISSELPEILGVCDRILVMFEGKIVGTLDRAEATQEAILSLCV